jgi:hypothetical protein
VLDGIFIGSEKAKELAAHLGDPVQLITPIGRLTPAGRIPGVMKVKVAGVFDANHYEYDRWLVYADLPIAQAFLRAGDRVSGIEVKIDDVDPRRTPQRKAVVAAANRLARSRPPSPAVGRPRATSSSRTGRSSTAACSRRWPSRRSPCSSPCCASSSSPRSASSAPT